MPAATIQQPVSSGIDALIQRLKQEGADEGRIEAQKLVADAEARARELLAQAEATAKRRTDEATRSRTASSAPARRRSKWPCAMRFSSSRRV